MAVNIPQLPPFFDRFRSAAMINKIKDYSKIAGSALMTFGTLCVTTLAFSMGAEDAGTLRLYGTLIGVIGGAAAVAVTAINLREDREEAIRTAQRTRIQTIRTALIGAQQEALRMSRITTNHRALCAHPARIKTHR